MNNEQEPDDRDLEIGRPHGPREDEEERDGLRVVGADSTRDNEEEEYELRDDDILFDEEDTADEGDLDFEPDDARD
jgi:hypothetical protein